MDEYSTRICPRCKTAFPRTNEFWYRYSYSKDGLATYCKTCSKAKARKWAVDNPDKAKAKIKKWVSENREQYYANQKRWRLENPEAYKASNDKYRETHLEQTRQATRTYQKTHPNKGKAQRHKRRARSKNAEGFWTQEDIEKMYETQKGLCWWRGPKCTVDLSLGYHIDHRVPLARGGTNWPNNLVLSCPNCNHSKNAKMPDEWIGRLL